MTIIWNPGEVGVFTARGTRIPNERPLPKPPESAQAAHGLIRGNHPHAILRSTGTTYNCAGLVLAFRRTFITDLELVPIYLAEDGYRRLGTGERASAGDVVLYRDEGGGVAHVGLVLEVPTDAIGSAAGALVVSKWGLLPEYIHRVMDKPPVLGSTVEYWTERQ